MQLDVAGSVLMLGAAVFALFWANSPWGTSYEAWWSTTISLEIGAWHGLSDLTIRDWITDGAMALFFFVVALEIKREVVAGELRDRRAAALPVVAALGGMIVPALIYLAINAAGPATRGWGIPMATDIAFAVAVVTAAGRHVPLGARLFLLTLAVVDDLGAIVVIAIFYTTGVALPWLAAALLSLVGAALLRHLQVRWQTPYVLLAAGCWLALHESGVHPTLAGVAFGFLTPARPLHDPGRFGGHARGLVDVVDEAFGGGTRTEGQHVAAQQALRDIGRLSAQTGSQLERLEYRLAPWVTFLIVPLFALANAGLTLPANALTAWLHNEVAFGVAIGLVMGKVVGVFGASWLCVRTGLSRLPPGTRWPHIFGVSICAGVGFTVAIFVSTLAFSSPALAEAAKMGILAGSLIASILGFGFLRWMVRLRSPSTLQR